jgi:glycosyltransferase involved in cell wall biosynthesis/tetratricopeptide (TPR) repeat protein
MKLSIVIPCYNESQRIQLLFNALDDFSKKWKDDYEIIIVDDGSTDNVVKVIKDNPVIQRLESEGRFILEVLQVNQGKGFALKRGVEIASGTHILTMDADLSYHPELIIDWLKIKGSFNNNEILLGSRLHSKSENVWEKEATPNKKMLRMFAGYIFSGITKILTTIKVRDNQSGFKLYPATVAKYLFEKMTISGWAHDVELLYLADLNRVKIQEMPVKCINREGSKISLVSDSLKMLLQLFWLGIKVRFNYYLLDPIKLLFSSSTLKQSKFINNKIYKRESTFRLLFSIATIVLFLLMPSLSGQYALSGDEWIQHQYGKEVFNYFATGDSTAYSEIGRPQNYDAIIYYSGGYELVLATATKIFPTVFEYDVRHFINSIVGCLLILFTGLFAKRLGGWRVGFFAFLALWMSPRIFGEIFNNSKDIPFAFGVVFSLYHMIPFLEKLPKPSWRSVILLGLGIGFTLSVRFGGFILFAYLGLFTIICYLIKLKSGKISSLFNKDFTHIFIKGIVIFLIAYVIGIYTWPWAMLDPINNPMLSMEKMTKFPITVQVLFNGDMINSGMPPWNYTLLWILHTTPEIILLGFGLSVIMLFQLYKFYKTPFIFFLLFVTIFPVAYAVYKGSGLYDGWRHFYFIYPTLVISAVLLINFAIEKVNNNAAKLTIGAIFGLGLFLPARKIIAYHPVEYVYFNDITGGLKGNYKVFETDYYMHSTRLCFEALAEKENFKALKDTIVIQTNMIKEVSEYAKLISPYIKVDYSKFENRTEKDYDYGLYMSRFVDFDLLKSDGWPAKNAIVTIERDEVPLTFAIKKAHKGDFKGTVAMKVKNYDEAIAEFESYLKTDPQNEAVLGKLGECYVNVGQNQKAIDVLTEALKLYPLALNRSMLGIAYAQNQNPQKALEIFSQGVKHEKAIFDVNREALRDNSDNMSAYINVQVAAQKLASYYYYMALIYDQMGDKNQAHSYMNLSQQYNPKK